MRWGATLSLALLFIWLPRVATAAPVTLQEYLFNLNGVEYHNDPTLPGLDASAFDFASGLGTLVMTFNPVTPGTYYFAAFFDHQLHVPFYDEYGLVSGTPGAGVSWQIDEPGFGDGNRLGTIYGNALTNSLDNTNYVPGITSNYFPCGGNDPGGTPDAACNNDVSLALGFNFALAANEQAIITLILSLAQPPGGFYLQQHSPAADGQPADDLFYRGALAVTQTPAAVPEPSTFALLCSGLLAAAHKSIGNHRARR